MKCEICGKEYKNFRGISHHIKIHKIQLKDYYNDYLRKNNNEGICSGLNCEKETNFISLFGGYCKFCSSKCAQNSLETRNKIIHTFQKHYGKDNVSQSLEIQERIRQTNQRKRGTDYPMQSKEVVQKRENLNKIKNVEDPNRINKIVKKRENTCLINSGYKNASQIPEIKEQKKKTNKKNCGEDHWAKSPKGRQFNSEKILKQIAWQNNDGKPIFPKVGEKEGPFFDKCELKLGIKFIRQDQVAGKWSDARPEPLWIHLRVEYNERNHYNSQGILSKYDIDREAIIASKGFIIYNIKESDCDINEDLEIEKLGKFIEILKEEFKYKNEQI